MVENAVVKDQLTEAMIEAGDELTRALEKSGLALTAALWFLDPEINEWRLLFASPLVTTKGPRVAYELIRRVSEELGERTSAAPFSAIGLLDEHSDLVKLLRVAIHTGSGIARIRFSKNVIHGHFVEDALIYKAA